MLELPGISNEDRALVFSNRSAAHLLSKNQGSLELTKSDAEWAVQLWPSWWRGYFRLGRAQKELHKLADADKNFNTVLALNPGDKDMFNELSQVRAQVWFIS